LKSKVKENKIQLKNKEFNITHILMKVANYKWV
jgi:hypothetical protein